MPVSPILAAVVFIGTVAAAWVATGLILRLLTRERILDHPNERSSHAVALPRGGGLSVIGIVLPAWLALGLWVAVPTHGYWWVLVGGVALAIVSWIDDLHGLPPLPRFGVQIAAVALGLAALSQEGLVFQGLVPPALDSLAAAVCWLWFVNLFNFMDGIDGLAGAEAASTGFGLFLVAMVAGDMVAPALPALALAGVAVGFLWWNWHPARVFLGDVGSVPLGYLLGWLLLATAAAGNWQVAVILPLYFLADATITLLRRLARGAKIWQAHREHFYQKAVIRGMSHARVAGAVVACNALLILLAVATVWPTGDVKPAWPLIAAALVVAGLLAYLSRAKSEA